MKNILLVFFFAALLIGSAYTQTGLKSSPQIIMLIFGAFVLGSFFIKYKKVSAVLLYAFLGALWFMIYFFLGNWIYDRDWMGVAAGLTALVLSPLTVLLYHWIKGNNRKVEMAAVSVFMVVTAIVYIKCELL